MSSQRHPFPWAAVIAFVIGIGLAVSFIVTTAVRAEAPAEDVTPVVQVEATKAYGEASSPEASDSRAVSESTHILP